MGANSKKLLSQSGMLNLDPLPLEVTLVETTTNHTFFTRKQNGPLGCLVYNVKPVWQFSCS